MAQELKIDDDFWQLFPDTTVGVVRALGVNNTADVPESLLAEANQTAQKYVQEDPISANPIVADWREAYRKFKTKKGARSSIEALMKRAKQGKPVSSINAMVDLYNIVSLTYGIPVGGENIDSLKGDMHLKIAQGGEDFQPLGENDSEPALPGEVVYQDGESIVCRCWNWRDGQRTMLKDDTTNAILVLENVNPDREQNLVDAVNALCDLLAKYVGGDISSAILSQNNPSFQFRN
ncbi:B3/B4 domain-containing protein [Levilactobacillus bambusae]|uniref:B3/B4 tRNA-binding domain-containing protein n=1 Tax=Levilactobacillus bambusae TaxID=2024736 RepID=A0A2V1N3A7_9LACO|nr:B3/4 domain-containing protein [Levilactobacillus bambusae]PWG00596.1 hypothetical protein DCM90_04875 [Levilactobacillus bambusae]